MSLNLVKDYQAGEVLSFDTIFPLHKDMVFRTAIAMLSDNIEAEDILQMVFIKVHQSKNSFKDDLHFKRWLYRITVNLCTDELRKRRNILRLDGMKEKGFEPSVAFSHSGLEARDDLQRALAYLDLKQRSVIILRYLHELSYEEIAKTLRIPLGTVKSRINTAVKIMRNNMMR